jgi:hypothetical protein
MFPKHIFLYVSKYILNTGFYITKYTFVLKEARINAYRAPPGMQDGDDGISDTLR